MSLCSAILSKFLSQYIQKIDKKQLNGSILKGHIELHNIEFSPNLLTSFGIPLLIKDSIAEQIEVDFPFKSNKNNCALLKIINVDIYTTIEWNEFNKVPINSIADLIQLIEKEKKALKADKKKAWNTWIEKVIDNAKIEIKNVRLHVEFTNWNKNPALITIYFESFIMNTINSNGEIIILTEKPEILTKRIKLTSFSIAINTKAKSFKNLKELGQIEYNFLNKSSFTFTIVHNRNKSTISNKFSLIFDPISFSLNQDQYFAINHLLNDFSKCKIRQKFLSCMKPSNDDNNEIEMWKYLNRCAKKIRHPHKFSPQTAIKFLKLKEDFAKKFMKQINTNLFVKISIKKYGEDLTFLLIQYASILIRREERRLQYDENNEDSNDSLFFSNDSVHFDLKIQDISFKLDSLLKLSINNISCLYDMKSENFIFSVDVQNCFIDDLKSNSKVVQTNLNVDNNNFINFMFQSKEDKALFSVSMIKFDVKSSFLKNFCEFFVNNQKSIINVPQIKNDENKNVVVKSSSISEYLLKINPKTFVKFQLLIKGISFNYTVINENESIDEKDLHSFNCDINQIILQNFSKESKNNVLSVTSFMHFGQIKVDDLIISEEFSLKSSTIGIIDEYYYLNDITTKLDVLNAKICFDNEIIDKMSNVLLSMSSNTQSKSTKVYSPHKIDANCSSISFIMNMGFDTLILSISEASLQPSFELKNISISKKENEKDPKIMIPSLCLNNWPKVDTDLINLKLNSYEFFDLLDEENWLMNKVTKIMNSIWPKKENEEKKNESDENDIKVTAKIIDYKMGDRTNSMKFENTTLILNDKFNLKIDSISLYDSENKRFVYCNDGINLILETSAEKNITTVSFPNLKMNFLWNELNQIIDYFQDSRDLIEINRKESMAKIDDSIECKKSYQIYVYIQNSIIDIENKFTVKLDDLKFDYLISEPSVLMLNIEKIDIDNLLDVNKFDFRINDFIYDISIESIDANLSQAKASKIFNLSFIPSILNNEKDAESKVEIKPKAKLQHDINMNINSFTFIESSTKLKLTIPIIKFTINSYHSIGAIQIPSISFEDLIFNDLEIYLLYNSIDYHPTNIDSVFSLDRKKVITEKKPQLTNLIIHINSIDFNYSHYFVMRIFNAYKIYSKYVLLNQNNEQQNNNSNLSISAIINSIIIKEHNLSNDISLFGLSFVKTNDLIEFICNTIECSKLIEMRNENKKSKFFILQKNQLNTKLSINPIDFYLNINALKTLTYIYESLASLIKTEFEEKINNTNKPIQNENKQNNHSFNLLLNGIQIHFPFEDDPLFKKHGLILSFDLQFETKENTYKLLNISKLNMFFKNYKKQIAFLPFISDASLFFRIFYNKNIENKNFDYSLLEIEIGEIDINLTVLDIFELRSIFNNLSQFFVSLSNPKTYSIPDSSIKEKKIFTAMVTKVKINPFFISLCEENRSSNLYNQILTLFIETKLSKLILDEKIQSFTMDLQFTMTHTNSLLGKLEILMAPTSLNFEYLKKESKTAEFSLAIMKDLEFNITPSSFQTIMTLIRKFKNKDNILLKKESKYNFISKYWIKNNLKNDLIIEYEINEEKKKLIVSPNDNLSINEFDEEKSLSFTYQQNKETFYPKNILFPTYFGEISVSRKTKKNFIKTIEFNSPLSIQNKLDFKIYIFIKSGKQFNLLTSLLPKSKYPISFENNQYLIIGDFKSIISDKSNRKSKQKQEIKDDDDDEIPQIDQTNLPEIFSLSLTKSPNVIKIQNFETKESISFNLNVSNKIQTNTRVYEIIPSLFIRNLMPYPTFYKIYNKDNVKLTKESQFLNIHEKKQINLFNHDNQSFYISFSIDIYRFKKKNLIKLDKENEIFDGSDNTAIQIQKLMKKDQKEIVIFKPCVIFNKTKSKIYFSPSSSTSNSLQTIDDFVFYGLESYGKNDNSMKIDISVENSLIQKEAIDCMQLNSNCTTIYLTRKDNPKLFYPINCSITLGEFPMNATHVVTFTNYLYVINNLPFDFSLIPATSNKVDLINSNYNNIEPLLKEIESESQFLLKDCFYIVPHSNDKNEGENRVLIDCVPKNATFLFSVSAFPNNPIIRLNSINRTVFLLQNRKESIFIEINIYEDKSTLYAHFQLPSFPVPLVINNSLKTPIFVHQNIKPNKNKLKILPDTSSLFAFKEPFINSKELKIEIEKSNNNNTDSKYLEFLFSMEEQLSPLICTEHNLIISTTIISKNNSKMIQIRYLNDVLVYQNNFNFSLSIHSLRASLNNEINEIALFTLKNIIAKASQDDRNTFLNLSIEKIQVDNQMATEENQVCLIGTGRDLFNETKKEEIDEKNQFFNLISIFPRGVPLFSMINYMSIQIKPIYVILESSFSFTLASFIKDIIRNLGINKSNEGSIIIEPSFNSVNINKTLIAYFEISPINVFIQIPTEKTNESFLKLAALKLLNMISLNKFEVSIPKIFASEFNNNISYLLELCRNFYGNEIINQVTKNTVIRFVASSLISFQKRKFVPLSSLAENSNNCQNLCDNRKPIFGYFNEIELNNIAEQTEFYFGQKSDVISKILGNDISMLEISHFDNENQSNTSSNEDRLVLGIKKDSIDLYNNYDSNRTDLVKVFQSNEIKRIRIPIIHPIYSSFDEQLKPEVRNEVVEIEINEGDLYSESDDEYDSDIQVDYISMDDIEQNEKESKQNENENDTKQNENENDTKQNENDTKQNENDIEHENENDTKQNENENDTKQNENESQIHKDDKFKSQLSIRSGSDSQNEYKLQIRNKLKSKYLMVKRTLSQIDINVLDLLKTENPAEIYLKIQTELLKDKKLSNQKIEFVIQSKAKDVFYCITNNMFMIFTMENNDIQITQKIELIQFNSVSSSEKIVSLKSNDKKYCQIDIEFKTEEDANTLVSFIRTQKKIISFFGNSFLINNS